MCVCVCVVTRSLQKSATVLRLKASVCCACDEIFVANGHLYNCLSSVNEIVIIST